MDEWTNKFLDRKYEDLQQLRDWATDRLYETDKEKEPQDYMSLEMLVNDLYQSQCWIIALQGEFKPDDIVTPVPRQFQTHP